jgi:hypothetical protein
MDNTGIGIITNALAKISRSKLPPHTPSHPSYAASPPSAIAGLSPSSTLPPQPSPPPPPSPPGARSGVSLTPDQCKCASRVWSRLSAHRVQPCCLRFYGALLGTMKNTSLAKYLFMQARRRISMRGERTVILLIEKLLLLSLRCIGVRRSVCVCVCRQVAGINITISHRITGKPSLSPYEH